LHLIYGCIKILGFIIACYGLWYAAVALTVEVVSKLPQTGAVEECVHHPHFLAHNLPSNN
jgi:hypothetical protein